MQKTRLDILLVKLNLAETRNKAQNLIESNSVEVSGKIVNKPSTKIDANSEIKITNPLPYVSRGGLKLEKALDYFQINPKNKICIDIGASTGGFTDCLLQHEAKKIYSVDVGTNQLSPKIKNNPKVISYEQTDIRNFEKPREKIDIITIDVSFISLKKVLPEVEKFLSLKTIIIVLIKPQFEGQPKDVERGVIKNEKTRTQILENLKNYLQQNYWQFSEIIKSPITGEKGNVEYLTTLKKSHSR